jgi:hypothetical protein
MVKRMLILEIHEIVSRAKEKPVRFGRYEYGVPYLRFQKQTGE